MLTLLRRSRYASVPAPHFQQPQDGPVNHLASLLKNHGTAARRH
jgi:hypothetical protein